MKKLISTKTLTYECSHFTLVLLYVYIIRIISLFGMSYLFEIEPIRRNIYGINCLPIQFNKSKFIVLRFEVFLNP